MSDKIEAIPETMEKFFGRGGMMVKPGAATVKILVSQVPAGKIISLDHLRAKIAADFKVDAACPAATTKALKALSLECDPVCYWRVINKKGEVFTGLSGGPDAQAERLEQEGLQVDMTGKVPVVVSYESKLYQLS